MSATTKPTALDRITRAAKNRVMTYAQVRYPGLAGTVVRSITSGGSKKKGGVGGGVAKHTARPSATRPRETAGRAALLPPRLQRRRCPVNPTYGRGTR
ncbi:hypothetical protein G7Y29_04170 [Corynebacterium qintianiae]|uniref:Uncharacterized protein n=1 Tax=Corynebacterium qintianiae TaxID=2709392 RepID=A0A7T0KPQ5_9CORY|nr:hypothetical protein [Corynebacterium qintianiae]QPK83989.1 hypothetical protein G7Y29_04170 [Corynebacterium qintianiae]